MPEIPDVTPGEPVESSWGNDIRNRTVQRYADSTERDSLVPLPVAGDPAWLDAEQELTIFDGTDWQVLADADLFLRLVGGILTGDLKVDTNINVGGLFPATPWSTGFVLLGAVGAVGSLGSFQTSLVSNYIRTPTGYESLDANGQSGAAGVTPSPDGVVRFVAEADFTDGGTGPTVVAELHEDSLRMLGGLRMEVGSPQLLDAAGTRRVGLFTTFSVWSDTNSNLRLRVGADDTDSYLVRFYDRAGAEDAIYSFTETGIIGPGTQGGQVDYAAELEALQAQVTALQLVVDAL